MYGLFKIIFSFILIIVLFSGSFSTFMISNYYAIAEESIPPWIKQNAIWWGEGKITDAEFMTVIEWLISNKIIDPSKKYGSTSEIDKLGFFDSAKTAMQNVISSLQQNPYADIAVRSLLPEIPVVGNLLLNVYDQSAGTTSEKNQKILTALENYDKLDEQRLKQEFQKLDDNKEEILKNREYLEKLVADTNQILGITSDTNIRVKNLEAKLDQISSQLSAIQLGKTTPQVSDELKNQITEITQLNSELSNEVNFDSSQLETLAKSYVLQADYNNAVKIYNQILNKEPKNYVALIEKAWALYDLEKYEEALNAFEAFIQEYPNDSEGWEGKGWALFDSDVLNLPLARASFEKSFSLDNSNVFALVGLAWVYIEEDNCPKANETLNLAMSLDNDNEAVIETLDDYQIMCT